MASRGGSNLPEPVRGFRRVVYIVLGLLFVGLAFLGAMLPLLPTTPFLLLASYFFVRSSARLNRWLLSCRLFGPFLRDWQRHRAVRPGVKITALLALTAVVACSFFLGSLSWRLQCLLFGLTAIGAIVVLRLPVIREEPDRADSSLMVQTEEAPN